MGNNYFASFCLEVVMLLIRSFGFWFSVTPACLPPPIAIADPNAIQQALTVLKEAKRPLVIIGKGV